MMLLTCCFYFVFGNDLRHTPSAKPMMEDSGISCIPDPPTGSPSQIFCLIDHPTVADLLANGTNVQWYETSVSTIPLDATVLLEDGEDYFATQTVAGCESTGRLQVLVSLDDPGIPGGDNVQEFCQVDNPTVANLVALGANIQWYSTSTSTNPLAQGVALVSGEDYYATQIAGGCESDSRFLVVAIINDTDTPLGESIQSFCLIDNPTVNDLAALGTNIQWYVDATSTSPLLPIVGLEEGEDYFATQTANGCESSGRFQVVVTMEDPPTPTASNIFPVFCQSDVATVGDLEATGIGIQWYENLSSDSPLSPNVELQNGEDYFATQTVDGCESTGRLQVIISIEDPVAPSSPSGDNFVSFCVNDAAIIGDLVAVGSNIQWYDDETGGTPIFPLTPLVDGEDYYATQTVNGCESSTRLLVNVTIYDIVPPTAMEPNPVFCSIAQPTLADINITGDGIQWYVDNTSQSPLDLSTPIIDGTTYFASQTQNGCESTNRLEITVTVSDPLAPTTSSSIQTFCMIDNPTLASMDMTGDGIQWYEDNTSTNPLSISTPLVDGEDYFATQTVDGCESDTRTTVQVVLENPLPPTTNNNNQTFCLGDNPTVSDISMNSSNTVWYDDAVSTMPLLPSTLLVNGEDYFASQIVNGCESMGRIQINITLNDTDAPIALNATQDFCITDNPTIADLEIFGTDISWYDDATGGTPLPDNLPLTDSENYFATQLQAGCESAMRTEVIANLLPIPDNTLILNAMNVSVCMGESTFIQILASESDVLYQLMDFNTGTPIGAAVMGNGSTISLPTGNLSENTFFQVSATNSIVNTCTSTLLSQVTVVVDDIPSIAEAGMGQVVCNESSTMLEAQAPSLGLGTWTQVSGPNTAVFDDENLPNATVSQLVPGMYTFEWTVSNGACAGTSDQVEIEVFELTANITTVNVSQVGGNDGSLGICLDGGTAPYDVLWTPDEVGQLNMPSNPSCTDYFEISDLNANAYMLGIVDDNGCTLELPNNVISEPDCSDFDFVNVIFDNAACADDDGGSITIEISGGQGDLTYDIGNGVTPFTTNNSMHTFDALPSGDYTINVLDERLCSITFTSTITLAQPDALSGLVNTINPTAIGASDGVICITPQGGTAPYSLITSCGNAIEGDGGCGGTFFIDGLPQGTCSITIEDANQCMITVDVALEDPVCNGFAFQGVMSEDASCNGSDNGSIEIVLDGGTAPFEYSIDGGSTFTSDNSNIFLFNDLESGTYDIEVRDAIGCVITSDESIVIAEPASLDLLIGDSDSDCFTRGEGSLTVEVNGGTPDYSYVWSNGGTAPVNANLLSGFYTVTVTDFNACTGTIEGEVLDAPTFNMNITLDAGTVSEIDINLGESLELMVDTDASNPTFEWSPPSGLSNDDTANVIATPTEDTEYLVRVTADSGCSDSRTLRVNVLNNFKIVIPNTFSPNGDSNNDDFYVITEGMVEVTDFKIYNRWGQLIHDNPTQPWDGRFRGKDQPVDTYVYVISYIGDEQPVKTISGDILLVR